MKTYSKPLKSEWPEICKRPALDSQQLNKTVKEIIVAVEKNADQALIDYGKKFDSADLANLSVSAEEINNASINPKLEAAIRDAYKNIESFHALQKPTDEEIEIDGVKLFRKSVPIASVGLYIPGGTAPIFSTILMTAIPAKIAGCKEIVLCTPPNQDASVNPAILFTAKLCGITKLFKVGGAQAIAAMAYGTESVPRVNKIFGPGNQYVTAAKQLLSDIVAIDIPAGPSEVLIIADGTAIPDYIAADLLSQAEHGADSQVLLTTTSKELAQKVTESIAKQIEELPRKDIAAAALKHSRIVILDDIEDCFELSNYYAPEHLIIALDNANEHIDKVINAGSVFLGHFSPESAGDYASGTNHVLPTNGHAKAYSGVSLDSFYKKITFQELSQDGLKRLSSTIIEMAEAENLIGHASAVKIRKA